MMCSIKYNEIWDKIKETLRIKFHSTPVYDEKYVKPKVREYNAVIKTNLIKQDLFRRMQIQNEKDKNKQIHRN